MEIFKLFGSVLVDSKDAENSISKTEGKAKNLGKSLGKGIGIAAKFGAALVVGAGAAAAGMFALGVKLGDTADEILDLNSITGMSTDSIQKWRKASEVAGVSTNAMTDASKKLTKSMDLMATGTGKGAESLEKLGLSFEEVENMSADERMNVLTEALSGVDDKTERARIGTDLFGNTWATIAPVVDLGVESMNKAKDSANIISEEDLKKANDFRIKVADMKDQLSFFVTKITVALMPALNGMMDWFSGKMPAIQSFVKTAFDNIQIAVGAVADFFTTNVIPKIRALWDWIQPHLPMIKEAFVTAFDEVMTVLTDVADYISTKVIAKLQELWDWISPHMPMIKEAMSTAFEGMKEAISDSIQAIKDITKWFENHWAIVEPILIGIAAGALAFGVITTAITLYGAVTKGITAIQLLFNAALTMNPIGIVVVAIGLLVAAGILLYRNWDVIKAKVIELWTMIKDKFTAIKDAVVKKVVELTVAAIGKFNDLKSGAINKFGELLSATKTKFNEVKNAIMSPINSAKEKIKGVITAIKTLFSNLKLKLPNIKTPHFKFSNWSMNPLDWMKNMPSIGIDWYAKGGVFNKPTLFDTASGVKGVGEAGPEAVLPLNDTFYSGLANSLVNKMGMGGQNQQIIITPAPVYLDGQKFSEITFEHNQLLFGSASKSNAFLNGMR